MPSEQEASFPLQILVASTNEPDLSWFKSQIEKLGHRVYASRESGLILQQFKKNLPDAVFIDAQFDSSNAAAILGEMHQHSRSMRAPVTVVMDNHNPDVLSHYAECGADDFFFNPRDANVLKVKLQTILNQKSTRHAANAQNPDEEQINQALLTLAEKAGQHEVFFRDCVRTLAKSYGCRYASIGLFAENSRSRIRTLALWAGEDFLENFEYDLQGTPCQDILHCRRQLIPKDVSRLYPEDGMLIEMGVESYFGTRLLSSDRGALGLVSVMDVQPLVLHPWTEKLLYVFASRIAMELTHQMDVEEKIKTEKLQRHLELLENSNRELKRFSEIASHTLQEPLRSIQTFASLIEDECQQTLPAENLDYFHRIRKSAAHMQNVILNQLTFSRIMNDPADLTAVNLEDTIGDILSDMDDLISKKNATVEIAALPIIGADKDHMRCLFENLIENALIYQQQDTTPTIKLYASTPTETGVTHIFVEDNGIGLDMHYAEKIFEPHSRLHTQAQFQGSGLGLAICKRIVEFYLGSIEVQSTPDNGSIFKVTLPAQNNLSQHAGVDQAYG